MNSSRNNNTVDAVGTVGELIQGKLSRAVGVVAGCGFMVGAIYDRACQNMAGVSILERLVSGRLPTWQLNYASIGKAGVVGALCAVGVFAAVKIAQAAGPKLIELKAFRERKTSAGQDALGPRHSNRGPDF